MKRGLLLKLDQLYNVQEDTVHFGRYPLPRERVKEIFGSGHVKTLSPPPPPTLELYSSSPSSSSQVD